ncbi:virion protein [Glossina pallidipes salivary gland hypertrophy virus]|uniref:Virion protein n=1 Tax=Glossina hytrovirus (isolate Glossina pallidipes/Ethiopia/Seibersdorf/-) TaxID=379529 RepID=A0A0Y0GFQ2_GHVS|nr:virion protein [Glossina pallidipes salivary gland hypertrophy virus]
MNYNLNHCRSKLFNVLSNDLNTIYNNNNNLKNLSEYFYNIRDRFFKIAGKKRLFNFIYFKNKLLLNIDIHDEFRSEESLNPQIPTITESLLYNQFIMLISDATNMGRDDFFQLLVEFITTFINYEITTCSFYENFYIIVNILIKDYIKKYCLPKGDI